MSPQNDRLKPRRPPRPLSVAGTGSDPASAALVCMGLTVHGAPAAVLGQARRRCESTNPGTCIQPTANPSEWVAEATRKDQHGPARWVTGAVICDVVDLIKKEKRKAAQ
jgi:hypothetical protein